MSSLVVPFVFEEHATGVVDALRRVSSQDGYPPPQDQVRSIADVWDWLFRDPVIGRWVAISRGLVAGHVTLSEPNDYLSDRIVVRDKGRRLAEVGKLFVAPESRGDGCGQQLIQAALSHASDRGETAVLAVLPSSTAAVSLYRHLGLAEIGEFRGVHGPNLVFSQSPEGLTYDESPSTR